MGKNIWFERQAEKWISALPVGNGHIGCMACGHPHLERLYLNDDTLWSGYAHDDYIKPNFKEDMQTIKGLMLEGRFFEAQELFEEKLTGRFSQAYMPLGTFKIQMPEGLTSQYRRNLDMSTGVLSASYQNGDLGIHTETYVSYPDDVMVHKITFSEKASITISFESPIMHEVKYTADVIDISGFAPSDVSIGDVYHFYSDGNVVSYDELEKSTKYFSRAEIKSDGSIISYQDNVKVENAKSITLIYSSSTSFGGNDEYIGICRSKVKQAVEKGTERIYEQHIADHSELYDKVSIDLGDDDAPAEKRFARMKQGDICAGDIELLFQYGRYLLIGASRKNSQAANLQGIWNKDLIPPWWSNYTLNINLQMNYWLADKTNLGECFSPLVEYAKRLCESGKRTAKEAYGARGSVANHQTDIWAQTTPVGFDKKRVADSASWAMWNMGLPWISIQLYDHYLYNKDSEYLKNDVLPIMENAAEFIMSNYTEVNGEVCNIPSTSPENIYLDKEGHRMSICTMSAMDIGITKEFVKAYIAACNELGQIRMSKECAEFAKKLPDYKISKQGALLEWDDDYIEAEKGHRHFSMLFGIYPCDNLLTNMRLRDAAEKALLKRLDDGSAQTGWSAVWAIALLARLGQSDRAEAIIKKLMMENIHENMFGAHPPDFFQIDANYGFTAAVCELLVQQYDGKITLLPALPNILKDGEISGLKLHGGHELSMQWKDGMLTYAQLIARSDELMQIKHSNLIDETIQLKKDSKYRLV